MIGLISKIYMQVIGDDIKRVRISSGDQIVIKLKNDAKLKLTIGRDQRGNTFAVFSNLLTEFHHMNRTNTNRGGWRDCDILLDAEQLIARLIGSAGNNGSVRSTLSDDFQIEVWTGHPLTSIRPTSAHRL